MDNREIKSAISIVKEVRDFFAGRIAIINGIPLVTLLASAITDKICDAVLYFIEELNNSDKQISGIAYTIPLVAD